MIFTEYNNQPCFKLIFSSSSTGLDTEKKLNTYPNYRISATAF